MSPNLLGVAAGCVRNVDANIVMSRGFRAQAGENF